MLEYYIMSSAIVVLFIVCIGVVILLSRQKARRMEAEEKRKEIEKNLEELEKSHETLSIQQKELLTKYDKVKVSEEKYKKLAFIDPLTEINNRKAFTEQLESTILTLRQDEQVSLMYLDIENLKEINDTLGLTYGDELLIDVSHRVKQVLDENDYLARYSGDEFIILTQNIKDHGEYEDKIKKVQMIFSYPFTLAGKEYFVYVNIGVYPFGKEVKTIQTALKNVDVAMYQAKELGSNQYCYYDTSLQQKLAEQIDKQTLIRTAVEQNEFCLYYQPILDLKRHKIIGLEALLRWNHPEKGLLLPIEFMEIAQDSGVIVPLGAQMMMHACNFLRNIRERFDATRELKLSINLSERELLDQELVDMLRTAIRETGILPSQLVFDVSEEVILQKSEILLVKLKQLKELGVSIALDHFGKELGSIALIRQGIFSYVKLDDSFSYGIAHSERDQLFVSNLVHMIEALGVYVIYEGIEEAEQLEVIEKMPSDFVQGFLFEKPMAEEQVLDYLMTWM